ncbi:hypothetical protein HAX54_018344 [Datura stramonium]|uniref:catechol oxidase n=1 Tax=Datura stramonium TaxID=4076 RepID=A0ABS8UM97_DATST|nr:hypothetical protein [Datura stramonium]
MSSFHSPPPTPSLLLLPLQLPPLFPTCVLLLSLRTSENFTTRKHNGHRNFQVSCKTTDQDHDHNSPIDMSKNTDSSSNMIDRRNVLLGLGGLYGASTLVGGHPFAYAAPVDGHSVYEMWPPDLPGFPNLELQVHSSWLFLPFHRCYLYFFERILGSLINDPTFVMPFGTGIIDGMRMPARNTQTLVLPSMIHSETGGISLSHSRSIWTSTGPILT